MNNGTMSASNVARLLPPGGRITHYVSNQILMHAAPMLPKGSRLDSRTILAEVESELAHLIQDVIRDYRPATSWASAFVQITEAQAGVESIVAREMTGGGKMEPIGAGATDMPLVNQSGKPFSFFNVAHSLGARYTYQEMLKAALFGQNLQAEKLELVRRGYDERVEEIAWFGDADHNLQGFFRNKRVACVRLTRRGSNEPLIIDGTGSETTTQIVEGILDFINAVADDSNDAHEGGVLTVPSKAYRYMTQTEMDSTNRITIAQDIQTKSGVTIGKALAFKDVEGSKVGMDGTKTYQMVALTSNDRSQMGIVLPHPHQFFAAQNVGMSVVIPSYAEIADVLIRSPKASRAAYYESA